MNKYFVALDKSLLYELSTLYSKETNGNFIHIQNMIEQKMKKRFSNLNKPSKEEFQKILSIEQELHYHYNKNKYKENNIIMVNMLTANFLIKKINEYGVIIYLRIDVEKVINVIIEEQNIPENDINTIKMLSKAIHLLDILYDYNSDIIIDINDNDSYEDILNKIPNIVR